ncbi:MAG: hypothetical protein JW983_06970 [Elusimicrobia bacterium]|nr:hypothetical protein [Elusimicrobiota bacterium]
MKKIILFLALSVFLFGCEHKKPLDVLDDPTIGKALGGYSGLWIIFDDSLNTGGGMMLYNSWDNQKISWEDTTNPVTGKYCIKYSWNGKDVYDYTGGMWQHNWCGFGFIVGSDHTEASKSIDLSLAGYTKLTFWARGSLSANTTLNFTGPYTGAETGDVVVTDAWQQYTISLTPSNMKSVTGFFAIIFGYSGGDTHGDGGTVYVDDIRYTQ